MKGIILSKTTGRMYGSEEEYLQQVIEPAFDRIRRYSRRERLGDETKITNRQELLNYIEDVTGTKNKALAINIEQTNAYDELIEENKAQRKEEIKITKIPVERRNTTTDRMQAKRDKLIFIGTSKKGQLYAYDYAKKKFTSPKKNI